MNNAYPWMLVKGELASKSNSRRWFGPGRFAKSEKACNFADSFSLQLTGQPRFPILEGEVVLEAHIYYASQRPDLDESLLMDCIQKAGLLTNDRQIREKHIYHGIDKANPRVSFRIYPR